MAENASVFARIIKQDKQADGTLIVTGIATDATLDVDEQICDPSWLKTAMPEWFRWGNIREQHSNIAAGVATEYAEVDDRHFITAHVVEPTSVKKVETGVLKGFSIGIRGPRVVKDDKAAGGRIVDGTIVEVSLVDRPANPACTLALAKTVDGTIRPVELLEDTMTADKTVKDDDAEMAAGDDELPSEEETTSDREPEETVDEKAVGDEESSQEVGEESSQEPGEESSREGGVAGVAGKSVEDRLDSIEQMLTMLCDKAASWTPSEDIAKAVQEVTDRVSVVEKAATKSAPVRMAVSQPTEPAVNDNAIKAAEYRQKAMNATDPQLAKGYLALATELTKTA